MDHSNLSDLRNKIILELKSKVVNPPPEKRVNQIYELLDLSKAIDDQMDYSSKSKDGVAKGNTKKKAQKRPGKLKPGNINIPHFPLTKINNERLQELILELRKRLEAIKAQLIKAENEG